MERSQLQFVPNRGQAPHGALFTAHGTNYNVRLAADGAELVLLGGARLEFRLSGAHAATVAGAEPLVTRYSYFYAHRAIRNLPSYGQVVYRGVYPGVDLVFRSRAGKLEYDWRLAAGAAAGAIRLRLRGYRRAALGPGGEIVLGTPGGEVRMLRPLASQGGRRVAVRYQMAADGRVTLRLGRYDHSRPLVIDPFIVANPLVTANTLPTAVAVDTAGNAWLAGNGSCYDGDNPVYLAEYSPAGVKEYVNSFGGCSGTNPPVGATVGGITTDSAGNIYLTGNTQTTDFPGTFQRAGEQPVNGAYLFEYSPAAQDTVFTAMLGALPEPGDSGGNPCLGYADPAAITLDFFGNVFIAGAIPAGGCNEPTTTPIIATTDGGGTYNSTTVLNVYTGTGGGVPTGPFNAGSSNSSAFVAEVTYNASTGAVTMPFNTLFGGSGYAAATAIAVASGGYATDVIYLAGDAQAADPNFPLLHALPNQYSTQGGTFNNYAVEGFVAAISTTTTGHGLMFSTLIPGTQTATGVAQDGWGNVFVTGTTGQSNNDCRGQCGTLPSGLETFSQEFQGSVDLPSPQAPLPAGFGSPVQAYVWSFNPESPDGLTSPGLTTGYAMVLGQQDGGGNPLPSTSYGLTLDASSDVFLVGATLSSLPQTTVNPANYFLVALQPLPTAENGPTAISGLAAFAYNSSTQQLTPFPLCGACSSPTNAMQAVAWGGAVEESQVQVGNPGYVCFTGFSNVTGGSDLGCLGAGAPTPLASLTAAANPLDFGTVVVGATSALQDATLANLGTTALAITSIGVTGDNAGDFLIDPSSTCPLTSGSLAPGASCTVALAFRPSLGTGESANLVALDNSGNVLNSTQTLGLSGAGEPALSISSDVTNGINFGTIATSRLSGTQTFRIENSSNQPLNIDGQVAPGQFAGDFHALPESCTLNATGAVPPFSSCFFALYFEPSFSAGTAESASFVVTAGLGGINAAPVTIPLTGTAGGNYAAQPLPEMVSVDNEVPPQPATAGSYLAAVSGGGTEVAFIASTDSSNLPGGSGAATGTNGLWIRYTCNGAAGCGQETDFIAYGPISGPAANGGAACTFSDLGYNQGATSVAMTPDGRFVAFNDDACASGSGVYGPSSAVTYLRDLKGQATTAPLLDANGNPLAGGELTLSADARALAYTYSGDNAVVGVTGAAEQVYLTDTCQSEGVAVANCPAGNQLVSQDPTNENVPDNSGAAGNPFVSPDGRYVAFTSSGTNLTAADPNINGSIQQVYLRDTCVGVTVNCRPSTLLVSAGAAGQAGNNGSIAAGVSAGGRYVVFVSGATNLPGSPAALNVGGNEVYVRDTCLGGPQGCRATTTLVSLDYTQAVPAPAVFMFDGQNFGADSSGASISGDGRVVGFDAVTPLTSLAAGVTDVLYAYDTCLSDGVQVAGCGPSLHAVSAIQQNGEVALVGAEGPLDPSGQFAVYQYGSPAQIWLNNTGVTVSAAPRIVTATLPGGTAGRAYSQTVAATGGTGALTYSVSSYRLPPGLSLNAATGAITGTPNQAGTFNFSITATDSVGLTGSWSYQVTFVCPEISFLDASDPTAKFPLALNIGLPISIGFGVTATDAQSLGPNGTPNTFAEYLSLTASGAPPGTLFNNFVLSGTPNTVGTYTLDVKASGGGCSADSGSAYVFDVVAPCSTPVAATVSRGGYSPKFGTKIYSQMVSVTYAGTTTLTGGLYYVITGLPAGVTVANATGATTCTAPAGSSYLTLSAGPVAPGATLSLVVQFNDPSGAGISYTPIIVGAGRP